MTGAIVAASLSHADDRVRLHALLKALDASPVALQRDLHQSDREQPLVVLPLELAAEIAKKGTV